MTLKNLAKNRTTVLLVVVVAGVLLMFVGRLIVPDDADTPLHEAHVPTTVYTPTATAQPSDARDMEERLEAFFSLVEGAGTVRVMLGFSTMTETVFAVDTTANESLTREVDAQGGTRDTQQSNQSQQTVLVPGNGGTQPLVLRETIPTVEGIVIIAQGGNDAHVRASLTRAAQAMLGLDAHRIQVLAMQN